MTIVAAIWDPNAEGCSQTCDGRFSVERPVDLGAGAMRYSAV